MKKLMQVFASVMIATSTFGGVTSVAAKENTPAYKIEYQKQIQCSLYLQKNYIKNMQM